MQLVPFYRHAFVRQQPRRYAVMQPPGCTKKYDDHHGHLTDAMLARQIAGNVTYAVPSAEAGLAHLLPFDIDAGGLPAIQALDAAAHERGLWGFGQYTPRANLPDEQQHGYYWLVFNDLVNASRLQLLGQELIAQVQQPEWNIESRATGADTRLPMTRHTHTGHFGYLVLDHTLIDIDADPDQAWAALRQSFRENAIDQLPPPPAPRTPGSPPPRTTSQSIDIARFNAEHDLVDLLVSAGATSAGRRMFLCPFHDDHHASLAIYWNRAGVLVCHCKSQHSNCPLAERPGNDAFRIHCIREQLSEAEALSRLNGHDQPKENPLTPPAAPGGSQSTPSTPKGSPFPPQTASAAQQPVQRATPPPESLTAIRTGVILAAALDTTLTNIQRAILRAVLESTTTLEAYQSVAYYAKHAPCSERAARYALRVLEQAGYLVRTRDRGPDGQTNVYRISLPSGRGGQIPAPTCKLESLPSRESTRASRGGQGEPPAERAIAGAEPAMAPEPAAVVSWPEGASYDPAADVIAQTATAPARSWGVDLRPSELYAFCHAARDAAARIQLRADPLEGGAEVETQQLAIAGELGDQADQDAPADPQPTVLAGPASKPRPTARQIPTDPQQRRRYFALLGKAKKAKSAAQARHLRELAAALLIEVAVDDLTMSPVPPAGRTRARPATPRATVIAPTQAAFSLELPREEVSGPATAPPPSSPGPELSEDGWGFEWAGSGWRAVHWTGHATRSYINPEAARRAIDRGEYTLLALT